MVRPDVIGVAFVGFGAGFATSYLMAGAFKPQITVTGTLWTYSGFPANAPLMGMGGGTGGVASAPINLGQTDASGTLKITGAPTFPAGNTVLYIAFVATDPTIYATLIVRS